MTSQRVDLLGLSQLYYLGDFVRRRKMRNHELPVLIHWFEHEAVLKMRMIASESMPELREASSAPWLVSLMSSLTSDLRV